MEEVPTLRTVERSGVDFDCRRVESHYIGGAAEGCFGSGLEVNGAIDLVC